jgi:2-desacetyl-2-hydroxyethyl bacteriochlorophyllide A dehydrogenase
VEARYIVVPQENTVEIACETLDPKSLRPMEVIVRAEASIVSAGTELARITGLDQTRAFPFRPGYGVIGRIEAGGTGLEDFKVGDRVFFAGKHASRQKFLHGQHHQWGYLYPVPDHIDAVAGVYTRMAQIVMSAPDVADLTLGDTVAVFGLGVVGNLAAQLFQLAGAEVIGLDPNKARCEWARKCGIAALDVAPDKQVETVLERTNGKGAMVTVDAAGHSAAIITAVMSTARFGQVILLGSPRAPYTADVSQCFYRIHEWGLTMRGAHEWRIPHKDIMESRVSQAANIRKCFKLIGAGKLKVRELTSHVIKPEQAPETYNGLRSRPAEYAGVVIDWR